MLSSFQSGWYNTREIGINTDLKLSNVKRSVRNSSVVKLDRLDELKVFNDAKFETPESKQNDNVQNVSCQVCI